MAKLPDGKFLAEVILKGEQSDLGGMMETAMYQSPQLAALVIGSAIFYVDRQGLDMTDLLENYRQHHKDRK